MILDRRQLLGLGCAAFAALSASPAHAGVHELLPDLFPAPAPRRTCPHTLCRHHRPGTETPGRCGLSLNSTPITELP